MAPFELNSWLSSMCLALLYVDAIFIANNKVAISCKRRTVLVIETPSKLSKIKLLWREYLSLRAVLAVSEGNAKECLMPYQVRWALDEASKAEWNAPSCWAINGPHDYVTLACKIVSRKQHIKRETLANIVNACISVL